VEYRKGVIGMYWMFILNDLGSSNTVILAQDIADYLLGKKDWQYTPVTPNISKINKDDRVLIYLAGKERRYFYAEFEIQEQVKPLNAVSTQGLEWEEDFNSIFKLSSPIDKVEKFKQPIILDEALRNQLSFIGDKKNWGLYFRQEIRSLSEQDYQIIVDSNSK
jgi:predicted RNA-binding protein